MRTGPLVLLLGCLSTLAPLTISLSLPALPELGADFGASAQTTQWVVTGALAGLAVGQLLLGPLSDAFGRRRPLLVSMTVYVVSAVGCLIADDAGLLVAIRVVQGAAASAGIVLGLATVRDRFSGPEMTRILARLAIVSGIGPVVTPALGALVLSITDWRGIFVVTAVFGALLLLLCLAAFPETAPPTETTSGHWFRAAAHGYARLAADDHFVLVAIMGGVIRASQFGYMAWASFVFVDHFGLTPAAFAVLYGCNALALIGGAQLSAGLIARVGPLRLLAGSLAGAAVCATLLVRAGAAGLALPHVVVPLFGYLLVVGMFHPVVPMLALGPHGERAGSAAALTGAMYFGLGAVAGPLAGSLTASSVAALGLVAASATVLSATVLAVLAFRGQTGQHGTASRGRPS